MCIRDRRNIGQGGMAPGMGGNQPAPLREKKVDKQGRAYATGKRKNAVARVWIKPGKGCLLYTSPSPRDRTRSRMPSSA